MRFGQKIIAGAILNFTSGVPIISPQINFTSAVPITSPQSTDPFVNPWGTRDRLGVGIGNIDPQNEIGFYGAYEACVVKGNDLEICDELRGIYEEH